MERTVFYFEKPGPENTEACLGLLVEAVRQGTKHVLVASTVGDTGVAAAEAVEGMDANLVVVTHSVGFSGPNIDDLRPDNRERIRSLGAKVLTATMPTHAIETSLMGQHQGVYPAYIIAQALRRFSQGVKVGVEICLMACDAGLVPEGEEVLTLAGTARGADTLMLLLSAPSKRFLNLKVLEILAKPR
ncbi:MAG: hypothetical protein GXP49_05045 [Deltaproteobacteria bacterium]|nr:hypothetical protein [Deltaproteobacteria bacterium]